MNKPDFLEVGVFVMVQNYWVAKIVDIAISETGRVMLLLKSPKGIWRNRTEEWLQYEEVQVRKASWGEVEKDVELHKLRINRMMIELDDLEKEWIQQF